jgi:hypothetical protein
MGFLARAGHLAIRSFSSIAVGDVGYTTFGYDNGQQRSKEYSAEHQLGG